MTRGARYRLLAVVYATKPTATRSTRAAARRSITAMTVLRSRAIVTGAAAPWLQISSKAQCVNDPGDNVSAG